MNRLLALCALLVGSAALLADKAEPPPGKLTVRELKVKGVAPAKRGRRPMPIKVANAEELAKAVTGKEGMAEITKQVDFKKEILVVFSWAGSGGDRLSYTTQPKEGTVTFHMKRGLTRDLRMHFKLYAVPKTATIKMGR